MLFETFKQTPERSVENWRNGRERFLQQAQTIAQKEKSSARAVESHRTSTLPQKTLQLKPVLIVFLVLLFLAGGGGLAVSSAQASYPGDLLYRVKTISEDIETGMMVKPENELTRVMDFTDRRVDEIGHLLETQAAIPQRVQNRYQNQLENAIKLALAAPDNRVVAELTQLRERVKRQQERLAGFGSRTSMNNLSVFEAIQSMLKERLGWIDSGIGNPEVLREQMRLREMERRGTAWPFTLTPGSNTATTYLSATPTPKSGNGYGPGLTPTGTRTPGDGYGPGPNPTGTRTPGGYKPNPTNTGTPGGNGPNPTHTKPTQQPGPTNQPQPTHRPGTTQVPGPKH